MRWKMPNEGDKRVVVRFAWFPIVISGHKIWLEKFFVKQYYCKNSNRWYSVSDHLFGEQSDKLQS